MLWLRRETVLRSNLPRTGRESASATCRARPCLSAGLRFAARRFENCPHQSSKRYRDQVTLVRDIEDFFPIAVPLWRSTAPLRHFPANLPGRKTCDPHLISPESIRNVCDPATIRRNFRFVFLVHSIDGQRTFRAVLQILNPQVTTSSRIYTHADNHMIVRPTGIS